jgi:hypothetical protein
MPAGQADLRAAYVDELIDDRDTAGLVDDGFCDCAADTDARTADHDALAYLMRRRMSRCSVTRTTTLPSCLRPRMVRSTRP